MTVIVQKIWFSETSCPSGSFDTTARLDALAAQQRNQRWLITYRSTDNKLRDGLTAPDMAPEPLKVEG
jgi:hypothetical protein